MTIRQADLLLRLFIVSFLLGRIVIASDIWSQLASRKPVDWSPADVQRLLGDSPWAMPVNAAMDDPADRSDPSPAALPGASEAGMPGKNAQGGARWDGGIGRNRMGRLPTIPVLVRWESAEIMQSALLQSRHPLTDSLAIAASKDYLVAITGLIPGHRYRTQTLVGGRKSSSSGDTADPSDPEEVLEAFMQNSRLTWKGGSLQPENVRLDADTGALHIFFSRADLSQQHNREVYFVTTFGSLHVQARFRLKDMSVRGKPDM